MLSAFSGAASCLPMSSGQRWRLHINQQGLGYFAKVWDLGFLPKFSSYI
jgi:hypothetical protein